MIHFNDWSIRYMALQIKYNLIPQRTVFIKFPDSSINTDLNTNLIEQKPIINKKNHKVKKLTK